MMHTPSPTQPPPERVFDLESELRRHGITRVRADNFEVNGFRYSNARDAIAEAKRHPGHAATDLHSINPGVSAEF